jgi:rubrerythrin
MGYKRIQFERNRLYDQVWEKPMIALALEYGLSDVGLRKICRRLNIPLPPQGYHLRKNKGLKTPLPPAKNGVIEYQANIYQPEQNEVKNSLVTESIPEISFEEQPENRIIVPNQLGFPHPLITEAKSQLKKTNPDSYGRISTHRNDGFDISVFPESIDRALRIMNALLKALAKRGYLVFGDKADHLTTIQILDEKFNIRLSERSHQVRHVPTKKELREKNQGLSWVHPSFDYLPTGELSLGIVGNYNIEKVCQDTKKGKIEEKLNAFIISLIKRALQMKADRAGRQREEEERRERERQRWEREIQMRKEQEQIDFLLKQCASWHESQKLRAFINATRDKFSTTDPESELAQWLIWASLQADRLDPLNGVTFQVY